MKCKYVNQETFEDISTNQTKLIEILNHRMSGLEQSVLKLKTDVAWIRIIGIYLSGIISALTIGILTKLIIGG
jgi:hypothetical protein